LELLIKVQLRHLFQQVTIIIVIGLCNLSLIFNILQVKRSTYLAVNLPWIATDYQACPFSKLNDGLLDVLFCEKLRRGAVLGSFLDAERGASLTLPNMQHYRVKALVLEPGCYGPVPEGNTGNLENLILDVSGERVPYGTIKVEVIPGVMNCIVPSWFDEEKWERNFRRDFPKFQT
jgi:diacylglycerol kinase family enzyme